MATKTIDELLAPITTAQAKDAIYTALGTAGVNTTQWATGAVVRTLILVFSIMIAALSQVIVLVAKSGFTAFAVGDWLTLLAKYVYKVDRIDATYAAGAVTLVNSGGGVYNVAIGALILKGTVPRGDGSFPEYVNQTSFTLNAGATLTGLAFIALEPGSASNAAIGVITAFTTPLLKVTATNTATFLATDQESDGELALRCANKLGSLSPFGPYDAYTYAATSALLSTGGSAGCTRIRLVPDGFGNIAVYCATATGALTGVNNNTATPLGAVADAINKKAVPIPIVATCSNATNISVAWTYELWVYNTVNKTDTEIRAAVLLSIQTSVNNSPVGGNQDNVVFGSNGFYFQEDALAAIFKTFPEIWRVTLTNPSGAVSYPPNQVLQAPSSISNANSIIHQTAPPPGYSGASVS